MKSDATVLITDIQRFCIHDGPGVRTTVFFKGCPLACRWCQNPETISFQNELIYSAEKCLSCGDCVKACPRRAIRLAGKTIIIDRTRCQACFECVAACPGEALAAAAVPYDSDSLLAEVLRDVNYYGKEGGITLSGGEPLAHPGFLLKFLPEARNSGLHITAETAGYVPTAQFAELTDLIDLFLFDVKVMDPLLHQELTGGSNRLILENLALLAQKGCRVQPRMPLVPGHNDSEGNLAETVRFLKSIGLGRITILPYHKLWKAKLEKINCHFSAVESHPPTEDAIRAASEVFESSGIKVNIEL